MCVGGGVTYNVKYSTETGRKRERVRGGGGKEGVREIEKYLACVSGVTAGQIY